MKKGTIWILSLLMAFALLGVCAVQLYYIKQSYNLKSQLFDQQINQVLANVVDKYQKHDIANHLDSRSKHEIEEKSLRKRKIIEAYEKAKKIEQNRVAKLKQKREREIENYLNHNDSIIRADYIAPQILTEDEYKALSGDVNYQNTAKVVLNRTPKLDENGRVIGTNIRRDLISNEPNKTFRLTENVLPDTIKYLISDPETGQPQILFLPKIDDELSRKFKLEDKLSRIKDENGHPEIDTSFLYDSRYNLIEGVFTEMKNQHVPLRNRINSKQLDSLLKFELQNKNIQLKYVLNIGSSQNQSKIYFKNIADLSSNPETQVYQTAIFKNDIFGDPGILRVFFPNRNSLIAQNMMPTFFTSAGLILVLLFIFSYTIASIIKQKKLAEMKIDFINNMTHEFKTPVSTIMIASESLKDQELNQDRNRVQRLANIIYEENVRLGHNIERVLNIAKMEKSNLVLVKNNLDLNALVEAVVDSMQLQLQRKNTEVKLHLCAQDCILLADELHLSNVIYNLIDNANKYSGALPCIELYTEKLAKSIVLKIKDNGIGMTKEQQKRIFEQFYRVPTGNLHDVKGFGLGLNYVRYVVDQMEGTIKLKSEKDKGSQFDLIFPIK